MAFPTATPDQQREFDRFLQGEARAISSQLATLNLVGLMKDAPHPNAGRLYANWLLGADGQKLIASQRRATALPSAMPQGIILIRSKGYPQIFGPPLAEGQKVWQKVFPLR